MMETDRSADLGSRQNPTELSCRIEILCRVPIEEVEWRDSEFVPGGGHDRPVLGADDMMKANVVPGDDVALLNRTILCDPGRQTAAPIRLVWKVARGMVFVSLKRRDVKVVG